MHGGANLGRGRAPPNRVAHRIVGHQHLRHGDALGVAGVPAAVAAGAGRRRHPRDAMRLSESHRLELVVDVPAVGAQRAHQPLRDDRRQAFRDLGRLESEIEQPRHGRRGVGGVQRAEHEMPGVRRLADDLRDFVVADLADHDDVRILPQHRSQDRREACCRRACSPESG